MSESVITKGRVQLKKKKKCGIFHTFGPDPPLLHSKCGKPKKKFYGLKTVFRPF